MSLEVDLCNILRRRVADQAVVLAKHRDALTNPDNVFNTLCFADDVFQAAACYHVFNQVLAALTMEDSQATVYSIQRFAWGRLAALVGGSPRSSACSNMANHCEAQAWLSLLGHLEELGVTLSARS